MFQEGAGGYLTIDFGGVVGIEARLEWFEE